MVAQRAKAVGLRADKIGDHGIQQSAGAVDEDAAGGISRDNISACDFRRADRVAEGIIDLYSEAAVAQGDRAGDVRADEIADDQVAPAQLHADAGAGEPIDGQSLNRCASVNNQAVNAQSGKAAVHLDQRPPVEAWLGSSVRRWPFA